MVCYIKKRLIHAAASPYRITALYPKIGRQRSRMDTAKIAVSIIMAKRAQEVATAKVLPQLEEWL
jgi:hypothetical protein